jgi:thiosulfate reductase cytochrome b subunit
MASSEQSAGIATGARAATARREVIYRHSLAVRLTHWINLLCLTLLLMSGLALFNVHPQLYWGHYGYPGVPTVFSITGRYNPETAQPEGVTYDAEGRPRPGAFPQWATAGMDLALARDWHFLMAWMFVINGTIYLLFGLLSGHFWRDLAPRADQLRPRHILADIWNHLRLRRARGEDAKRYNVLQKFAYLAVIFILLPAILASGLTMSPAATAAFPFLFDLFAGRQSARTIHFICANLLLLFVLVHVVQVLLSGAFNLLRSMITGRYVIKPERTS